MENTSQTLSVRQQKIIAISAFTAKGDIEQMKISFAAGLQSGLTVNEINEELAHLYAYCGFAASVRGTNIFKSVVTAREAEGIKTEYGRTAGNIEDKKSKYERGEAAQEIVTGMSAAKLKEAFSFNAVLDVFLKEHLFADIFGSDLLSFTDRELITVSALVAMREPLVLPHFTGALNVGISEAQLKELLLFIESAVGSDEAEEGRRIFEQVLKDRNAA
ncbi:carboxymuconolactone decarboxylase family protein [Flavobacterium sp. WC2416]|uniref:Carboxymuconolactone decarboxylase family protein n=1 Tax=Flavobacterium sp. WC2416 TaxID=3234141 RepID=A0AB39W7Z6_9FLAO